ncbi:hypothetical protein Gain_0008_035 [Komagataeibacter intermedius TF2]|uniref:Uncharacterized protein n=1 Tax=Komagataeibacter intermedius NRIC 0521 TaxID=1307934 RepID=A0ABQ0PQQ7_9PROT|nr:hypothetical protein Gain_0008_035 [Komagataeibacter intermedius TF2]GBQ78348.1 hypothetical protein AA0521_3157 [Komagataeibacter intermedius NRIC 0521]
MPVDIDLHADLPGIGYALLGAPAEVACQFLMHVGFNMDAMFQQEGLKPGPVPEKMLVSVWCAEK